MTSQLTQARPAFTFESAGQDFTLVRNADDNYTILDSAGNPFTLFSYGGDPEDSFELEAAAIASVEYKIAHNL